jgi:hypothetical protein
MSSPHNPTQFFGDIAKFKKDHKQDILAIKALHKGVANEAQQIRALAFIVKTLCRADEINYFSNERDTCFALGREAVGKIIRGIALDSDYIDGDKL